MNADEIKVREIQVKSILSTSNLPVADYSVNPYVGCPHACKYCYASFMKRFTGHPEPWGTFLDVKYWPEIRNPGKYAGKQLFIGSVTDPYGPQEKIYKRTRALLEQLQDSGAKISIATKSDLVLRDLNLIKTFPHARVSWSVNTLDERFQADMDMAVSISRRLAAMKAFHEAGIRTTCFISPIFPSIRKFTRKAAAATGKNWTPQYGRWRKNGGCRICAMTIPCTGRSTNRRLS